MENKKKCDDCKFYRYTSNILGGVTTCTMEVKFMNTFIPNEACDKFELKEEK